MRAILLVILLLVATMPDGGVSEQPDNPAQHCWGTGEHVTCEA